jgi:lysophospholipase L1-like esterase
MVPATLLLSASFVVLIDFAIASARGWSLQTGFDRSILVIAAVVAGLTLGMLVWPAARRLFRAHGRKITLAAMTTLLMLGLSELSLRLVAPPGESFYKFHRKLPWQHYVFHPDPQLFPGIEGEARYRTNRLGIRGVDPPKHEETRRIVCVGGSTTICTYLDDTETWCQQFMDRLNEGCEPAPYWVGNAGRNGYATEHHLRFLEDAEFFRGMDAVVFLVGVNDFSLTLSRRRLHRDFGPPPLVRRLAIVQSTWHSIEIVLARERHQFDDDTGQVMSHRRNDRRAGEAVESLPDLTAALDGYEARLCAMITATRARGAVPVFLTQPTLWRTQLPKPIEDRLWFGYVKGRGYLSVAALRDGMDRYNARLTQVCAAEGVHCVDLSAMDGVPEYYYDDCHFTEEGAAELARILRAAWPAELGVPGEGRARPRTVRTQRE